MDNAFVFQFIFLFLSILPHSYSQATAPSISCSQMGLSTVSGSSSTGSCGLPSSKVLRKVWKLDLNATFFVNNILVDAITNDSDSVSVNIGTTSCDTFPRGCYVTCVSRQVVQQTGCYVTINVTCSVTNVKGRYVRLFQNRASELALCGVKVMGDAGANRGLKNYALKAPTRQTSWVHYRASSSYAVDGSLRLCSYTFTYHVTFHWWQVDLGRLILVSHIIIASSENTPSNRRLANVTVELGRYTWSYSPCRHFNGSAGVLTTFNCTNSMWGRFVRVSRTGWSLILCEVEVYGDTDAIRTASLPVSALTSNLTWGSVIESEVNETSLETSEENLNSSSTLNITEDGSGSDETVTAVVTGDFVDEETRIYCTTCNCQFLVPKTQESVQQEVKETVKELKVQTSEMSKQVRKKSSIPDERLSSQAVGLICILTISSIFAVIVACDVCHLLHYLLHRRDEYLLTK